MQLDIISNNPVVLNPSSLSTEGYGNQERKNSHENIAYQAEEGSDETLQDADSRDVVINMDPATSPDGSKEVEVHVDPQILSAHTPLPQGGVVEVYRCCPANMVYSFCMYFSLIRLMLIDSYACQQVSSENILCVTKGV